MSWLKTSLFSYFASGPFGSGAYTYDQWKSIKHGYFERLKIHHKYPGNPEAQDWLRWTVKARQTLTGRDWAAWYRSAWYSRKRRCGTQQFVSDMMRSIAPKPTELQPNLDASYINDLDYQFIAEREIELSFDLRKLRNREYSDTPGKVRVRWGKRMDLDGTSHISDELIPDERNRTSFNVPHQGWTYFQIWSVEEGRPLTGITRIYVN